MAPGASDCVLASDRRPVLNLRRDTQVVAEWLHSHLPPSHQAVANRLRPSAAGHLPAQPPLHPAPTELGRTGIYQAGDRWLIPFPDLYANQGESGGLRDGWHEVRGDFRQAAGHATVIDPRSRKALFNVGRVSDGRWCLNILPGGGPKQMPEDRLAQAKARMKEKRVAWQQDKTSELALKEGWAKPDGTADVDGYKRHRAQERAREAGFLTADGQGDVRAFNRSQQEARARSKGFVTDAGPADMRAYYHARIEQSARTTLFLNQDGSGDIAAYRQHRMRCAAVAKGFFKPDGSPDVAEHVREWKRRVAVKAGFLKLDGSPDVVGHYIYCWQQGARKAGFVDSDGYPDTTAYRKHLAEQREARPKAPRTQPAALATPATSTAAADDAVEQPAFDDLVDEHLLSNLAAYDAKLLTEAAMDEWMLEDAQMIELERFVESLLMDAPQDAPSDLEEGWAAATSQPTEPPSSG